MSHPTPLTGRGRQREPAGEKFWRTTLRAFAASGQSVRGFCRVRGLSEPSFYAWRRTLTRRDAGASKTTPKPAAAFVPVRLAPAPAAGGRMEIVLAGGVRLRLRPPVDRAALAEVLAMLQSPACPSSSL